VRAPVSDRRGAGAKGYKPRYAAAILPLAPLRDEGETRIRFQSGYKERAISSFMISFVPP
jgi:hypothetical protein